MGDRGMGDRDEEGEPDDGPLVRFWAKISALLTIFGTAFAVATYVIPVGTIVQRIALSALIASVAALTYSGIEAIFSSKRTLDPMFAFLAVVTLGFAALYAALLAKERDATIAGLEQSRAPNLGPAQPSPTAKELYTTTTSSPAPINEDDRAAETDALPEFGPSSQEVAVLSSGPVRLSVGEYGLLLKGWYSSNGRGGDLGGEGSDVVFAEVGITGREGTRLALVEPGSPTTFEACRDVTSWVPSLTWRQVRCGTFVCLGTPERRRGIMRINEMPDFNDQAPVVGVEGVTWQKIVDG